jgi:hypothetical protein
MLNSIDYLLLTIEMEDGIRETIDGCYALCVEPKDPL